MTATTEHGRLRVLDGVRGLAILMVVLYHSTVINPQNAHERWFYAFMDLGRFGVDLFFVLSGFLITGILVKAKGKPGYFRNFYMRRLLRIFPLYYALIAFSFLAFPLMASLVPRGADKLNRFATVSDSWLWYVAYLTNFLVALRGKWTHGILDVTWSLCIEEHFYLIWPLIVLLLSGRRLRLTLIAVVVGSVAVRMLMWSTGFTWLQIYVLTFSRLDGLALGGLLSLSMADPKQDPSARKKTLFALGAAGAVVSVLLATGNTGFETRTMSIVGFTLMGGAFVLLLRAVLLSPERSKLRTFFSRSWLVMLGKYSYALYLFHLPVRAVIRDLFWGDVQFRALSSIVYVGQFIFYAAALGVSLLFAWLSWNLLEKRFLALKDRFAFESDGPSAAKPALGGAGAGAG